VLPATHGDSRTPGVYVPTWQYEVVARADRACVQLLTETMVLYVDPSGRVLVAAPERSNVDGKLLDDGLPRFCAFELKLPYLAPASEAFAT
jgi:hypothetical protein